MSYNGVYFVIRGWYSCYVSTYADAQVVRLYGTELLELNVSHVCQPIIEGESYAT